MRYCAWIFLGVLVCATGCASTTPGETQLRQRAETLWTAREAEDWSTVFEFLEPARREATTREKFVTWADRQEPFRTHAADVQRVQVADELGWVEVDLKTSFRKMPQAPVTEVVRWEKWRVTENEWYPVPRPELDGYPAAPATRDLEAEAALRERWESAWHARSARDWKAFYQLIAPADREKVPFDEYAAEEEGVRYISHDLKWVEVVGDIGRVRVIYEVKSTDPAVRKAPPHKVDLTEQWITVDGKWYRKLLATP